MTIQNTNFLQPSGFRLLIDRKNYPHLEYFVQGVDHPSVSAPPAVTGFRHITDVPQVGDKLEFSEVTFDIMLDENMEAYTEMYNWLKRIVETNFVGQQEKFDGQLSAETDISLNILNSSNQTQKRIAYRNAYPVNLGNVRMESNVSDAQIITLPVSFRYTYFEII